MAKERVDEEEDSSYIKSGTKEKSRTLKAKVRGKESIIKVALLISMCETQLPAPSPKGRAYNMG